MAKGPCPSDGLGCYKVALCHASFPEAHAAFNSAPRDLAGLSQIIHSVSDSWKALREASGQPRGDSGGQAELRAQSSSPGLGQQRPGEAGTRVPGGVKRGRRGCSLTEGGGRDSRPGKGGRPRHPHLSDRRLLPSGAGELGGLDPSGSGPALHRSVPKCLATDFTDPSLHFSAVGRPQSAAELGRGRPPPQMMLQNRGSGRRAEVYRHSYKQHKDAGRRQRAGTDLDRGGHSGEPLPTRWHALCSAWLPTEGSCLPCGSTRPSASWVTSGTTLRVRLLSRCSLLAPSCQALWRTVHEELPLPAENAQRHRELRGTHQVFSLSWHKTQTRTPFPDNTKLGATERRARDTLFTGKEKRQKILSVCMTKRNSYF